MEADEDFSQQVASLLFSLAKSRDPQAKRALVNQWGPNHKYALVRILPNEDFDISVRILAASYLGVEIRHDRVGPELLPAAQTAFLAGLTAPSSTLHDVCATYIVEMVLKYELQSWPGLVPALLNFMRTGTPESRDASLMTLGDLVNRDGYEILKMGFIPQVYETLIPLMGHMLPAVRANAVRVLEMFLSLELPSGPLVEDLLEKTLVLVDEKNVDVKRMATECMTYLASADLVSPSLVRVFDHMVKVLESDDSNNSSLLSAALEFWTQIIERPVFQDGGVEFLPRLISSLLKQTRLSKQQLEAFQRADEINSLPLKDGEIDDLKEEEEEIGYFLGKIRRTSASVLCLIMANMKKQSLQILIPTIREMMKSDSWIDRETAVYALGAIAKDCEEETNDYFPDAILFLLPLLRHDEPFLASTTCWTIRQYSAWLVREGGDELLHGLIQTLRERTMDPSQDLMINACSALAALIGDETIHIFEETLLFSFIQTLSTALHRHFKAKPLDGLYAVITSLCDALPHGALNSPGAIDGILKPVLSHLFSSPPLRKANQRLFLCISSMMAAFEDSFLPYLESLIRHCYDFIQSYTSEKDPYVQVSYHKIASYGLDVLDSCVENFEGDAVPLLQSFRFFEILVKCIESSFDLTRCTAYGMIGEIATRSFSALRPFVERIMAAIKGVLESKSIFKNQKTVGNAIWALSCISAQLQGEEIELLAMPLVPLLINHLSAESSKFLRENAALALGALAFKCSGAMAPFLPSFIDKWSSIMSDYDDQGEEKQASFRGVCLMILKTDPKLLRFNFGPFCAALLSWPEEIIPADLNQLFYETLQHFKMAFGDEWALLTQTLPSSLQEILAARYYL